MRLPIGNKRSFTTLAAMPLHNLTGRELYVDLGETTGWRNVVRDELVAETRPPAGGRAPVGDTEESGREPAARPIGRVRTGVAAP